MALMAAGCSGAASLESARACLEEHLPDRVALAEWPEGPHVSLDHLDGFQGATRVWVTNRMSEAKRIEMGRKGNRTMGVFGMFRSDAVERRRRTVVEFERGGVPDEVRDAVRACTGI